MQNQPQLPEQLRPARAIFRAVVQTVLPETVALNEEDWGSMEGLVSDALRLRPARELRQLRLFLHLIEWAPVFRYGCRFTSLDQPRRVRVLRYLQDHPVQLIRSGFWGLRTLAFLGHYGRPEVARALGYQPEARGWEAHR